jgi:broad specificity phosphatase PhoE
MLLIRHGHTHVVGRRLVGRLPGVSISARGTAQVAALRRHLATTGLGAVYSSPLERAIQTAEPLARDRGLDVTAMDGLTEVDFGEWTGRTFDELAMLPEWRRFNTHRSTAVVPAGETAVQVQSRFVRTLEHLRQCHPNETIALVSHQDVIRSAVLHCVGAPLDSFDRFEIAPASITALALDGLAWRILCMNGTSHLSECGAGSGDPERF